MQRVALLASVSFLVTVVCLTAFAAVGDDRFREEVLASLYLDRSSRGIAAIVNVLEDRGRQFNTHRFNILWAERRSFLVGEQHFEVIGSDVANAVLVFS
jgi:hypothetical protein